MLVQLSRVEVGLLAVHDGVEPAVLVRLVLDRPDGAVRFDHRVEPGHRVAGPRLVLALHVAGVRVVHVVVERIVHRLVGLVAFVRAVVVQPLVLVAAVRRLAAGRRTPRPRDHAEQNAKLHRTSSTK